MKVHPYVQFGGRCAEPFQYGPRHAGALTSQFGAVSTLICEAPR